MLHVITSGTLIFPHQLFKTHPAIAKGRKIFIVEEWLFFNQFNFIKQKLLLHRASMKYYSSFLQQQGFDVSYIEAVNPLCDVRLLLQSMAEEGIQEIHYADVADSWLERRMQRSAAKNGINLLKYDTPNFLNQPADVAGFFAGKKKYFFTDFYIWQRKKREILLIANDQPEGGKWSFDYENRKKMPKGEQVPSINFPKENEFVKEARAYINLYFDGNYGTTDSFTNTGNHFFPTTFSEAETWLDEFLQDRLDKFGVYEDAMVANESFLFHSVLTPMLNIGLLNPQQVIDKTLAFARKAATPLNSLEGFLRQIMGWREFIHAVYEREGSRQRTKNHWGFKRKIPKSFWSGTTGIVPIDTVINRILKVGWCHHIERLMVMGNFMLLCEFDPDEVYKWFMEMFVDSYDWVMVPNTYGMTQFADGGIMMTKPYISASNYIMKMSDYPKGGWQLTWDGLFWRFMHIHRDFLSKNQRLSLLLGTYDKMPSEKQQMLINAADDFLHQLDIADA